MSRLRASPLIAFLLAAGMRNATAQSAVGGVYGVVVSQDGGMSLPYGVIAVPALGLERFTTVAGSFVLNGLPAGPLQILVRRLGYVPKELTVTVRAGLTDTIRVELARVAVRLAAMQVRAYPECKTPGPPNPQTASVLATVFTQLRMNADQYRLLAASYPFSYAMTSVLGHFDKSGQIALERSDTMRIDGLPNWRYKPGKIASRSSRRGGRETFVNLLTLIDVADSTFVHNHCFYSGGLTQVDSATHFRIDFVASSKIKDPDFSGSIYLDTATYQIRRSVLHVIPLPRIYGMTDLEVTTDFAEVLPSIPVIAKVSSTQTFNTQLRGVAFPTMFDEQRIIGFAFRDRTPEEQKKP